MKRLLFRLLLTASLLVAPLLVWVRMPLLHFVFEGQTDRTEAADESITDDAEWETCLEEAQASSATRARAQRRIANAWHYARGGPGSLRGLRFELVVDVRRVKPKRLFAPPYLQPRVVRLLS